MLVPDILWYEKSILGWFRQPGRTCQKKKLGVNYQQLLRAFFYVFKGKKNFFLFMKTLKNGPQKLLTIGPTFFWQVRPGCLNQPRIDFSYHKYAPRFICLLICGFHIPLESVLGTLSSFDTYLTTHHYSRTKMFWSCIWNFVKVIAFSNWFCNKL